jgi:hypothetical protein
VVVTEEPTVVVTEEPTVVVPPTIEVTPTATVQPTVEPTVTVTPTVTITPTESLAAAGEIGAQAYDSAFSTKVYAMNVGTGPADIAIQYYDGSGNPAGSDPICASIPANGRCIFDGSALTNGFIGSGVIQASQPVAAAVRIIGQPNGVMSDYSGVTQGQGDTIIFLPSVHRSSWRTTIGVQNLGSTTAPAITLKIRNEAGTLLKTVTQVNVASNQTVYFNLYDASYQPELGSSFAGSATVEGGSNQLYGIVHENNTSHGGTFAYESFKSTDGGSSLFFPVLHRNRAADGAGIGWNSSSFIQNLDAANPVTVHVKWQNDVAQGGAVVAERDYPIAAGSSLYLSTVNAPGAVVNYWAGSMVVNITSGAGPVVGISSELYQTGTTAVPVISAYAEFRAVKEGFTTLYSPIAEGHYNGIRNTGAYARHFIQNVASTPNTTATIHVEWVNSTTGAVVYAIPTDPVIPTGGSFYIAPNAQTSTSGVWNFSGTLKVTSLGASPVPVVGLTYDSFLGSSPNETGYPNDTTGLFNMYGQ